MFSDPSSQARGAAVGAMSGLGAQAKSSRKLLNGILYFLGTVLGFGLLFGLNVAAWGLGRNSAMLGFNLPPWALPTPLDRREKLGSTRLDGPVGGSLAS